MGLSDQIKVPAQVKGAVGGGGGSLSAADIRNAIYCGLADVSSTANGLVLNVPGSPSLSTGLALLFEARSESTGGMTVNIGGGPVGLYHNNRPGFALTEGAVKIGGLYPIVYHRLGYWQLINPTLAPGDMPDLGFAQVYLASNLTGQGGSYATVTVAFSTVYLNTQSNFSFAGGVATCLVAGRYQIVSQLARNTPGYHFIRVNSNNPGVVYTTTEAWTQCVLTIDLQAGDTVRTSIASSGAATIYAGDSPFVGSGDATWMSLRRVK